MFTKEKSRGWRIGLEARSLESGHVQYTVEDTVCEYYGPVTTVIYEQTWEKLLFISGVALLINTTARQAKYIGDEFMEPLVGKIQPCARVPFQAFLRRRVEVC